MKVKETEKKVTKKEEEFMEPEDLAYAKKIAELKKIHKRVYATEIAGEKILWRPLKRSEYKAMLNMEFPEGTSDEDKVFDRETFVAECVILYPENATEDLALAAEIITDACMRKSGFNERYDSVTKEV
ncbi:MAG: hypothetical protein ACI3T9_02920 [Romboutsia timonensis]